MQFNFFCNIFRVSSGVAGRVTALRAGWIPDGNGTVTLASAQHVTESSASNISWGVNAAGV